MRGELVMPNWSLIVHGRVEEGRKRITLVLKEIAENLDSEMAFLLTPSIETSSIWRIPAGWIYSEKDLPTDFSICAEEDIIKKSLLEESVVLDSKTGDRIPEPLARLGIKSAIGVALGYPEREALLIICNGKKLVGKIPFQVHYTKADNELAVVIARVISLDGVERFIHKEITGMKPKNAWAREKERLLKTNRGWFVAYQEGKRVALEPSLDALIAALDKDLGTPRKPCEFHEIIERPPVRRGPSPRLMPINHRR